MNDAAERLASPARSRAAEPILLRPASSTAGEKILAPAGTVHATGAGVFVAEVQEPTDRSILPERSITTSGREESHLSLGCATALQAVDRCGFAVAAPARCRPGAGWSDSAVTS